MPSQDSIPLTSAESQLFSDDEYIETDGFLISPSQSAPSYSGTDLSAWDSLVIRFSRYWRKLPQSWSIERDPHVALRHLLTLFGFLSLCIFLFSIPAVLYLVAPRAPTPPGTGPNLDEAASTISGKKAAVAADNPICSDLGLDVMRSMGGNAADAMVSTVLCQGILSPFASGIGGGAFILVFQERTGISTFYDARETAPSGADMNMYSKDATTAKFGGMSVGVPGELRGIYEMHQRWGRLNWTDVVQPAVKIAEKAKVGQFLAIKLRQMNETIFSSPGLQRIFTKKVATKKSASQQNAQAGVELPGVRLIHVSERGVADSLEGNDVVTDANDKDKHGINGTNTGTDPTSGDTYSLHLLEEGDKLVNEPLINLLKAVAERGPDAFYKDASESIARQVQAAGGILTAKDIQNYKAVVRDVVTSSYQGFQILGAPLPSAGGATIGMALNMITELQFRKKGRNSVSYQMLAETLKWVFGARMGLGDPDYVANSQWRVQRMMSRREAVRRVFRIAEDRTYDPRFYTKKVSSSRLEGGTSHISILDENNTAISLTTTINLPFGAGLVSNSTGVILNDQMDSFTTSMTRANAYGVYPSTENRVEGGKRPMSSMCPTIVLWNGRVYLVLGGSGGPKAMSGVLQTIVNVLDYGDSLSDAISAPRIHHQLVPNKISMEGANGTTCEPSHTIVRPSEGESGESGWGYWKSVCMGLTKVGHKIEGPAVHGAVQAVLVPGALGGEKEDGAKVLAASDPRRIGKAAAY